MKTTTAVILVAGRGERLQPLTNDRPKALIPLGTETLLGRTCRLLVGYGVSEIVLATGYREEAVREAMIGVRAKVTLVPNVDWSRTQNSVSLGRCADAVGDRAFFKLDGDLLFRPEVLERLDEAGPGIATAVEQNDALGAEEMKVTIDGGRITAFGKHLDPRASFGESIGLERLSAGTAGRVFEALRAAERAGKTNLYYEDVYADLVAAGEPAPLVDVTDLRWFEIDTLDDLEGARALLASGALD